MSIQNLIQLYAVYFTYFVLLAWKWLSEFKICSKIKGKTLNSCADGNLLPTLLILICLQQIWKRCRCVRDPSQWPEPPRCPWMWYLMTRMTWPWAHLTVTAVQTGRWVANNLLQLTWIAASYCGLGLRLQLECVSNYDKFAFLWFAVIRVIRKTCLEWHSPNIPSVRYKLLYIQWYLG